MNVNEVASNGVYLSMDDNGKIKCRHTPWKGQNYPDLWRHVEWKKALPFAVNPRAILIHRVKSVSTHFSGSHTPSHNHADYWCGNGGNSVEIVAKPPEGRLVCARCEKAAVLAGEKSSSDLVGSHVCLGELRAKKLCCTNEDN